MNSLIKLLNEGKYSCVIANNNDTRTFSQRGVLDLYDLLKTEASFMRGAMVADKVVGKAAAALMALGKISKLHTNIISTPALDLLKNANIEVDYNQLVPHIINRNGDDWCPLERRCFHLTELSEMEVAIEEFIVRIRQKPNY